MHTEPRSVKRVIEGVLSKLNTADSAIDSTGRDRNDYSQLFQIKAWLVSKSAPTQDPDSFERWRFVSLRNEMVSCIRERGKAPEVARYDLLPEGDRHAPSFEYSMALRDLLWKLRQAVTSEEWDLLATYADHSQCVASVWRFYGETTTRRNFRKKIQNLRKKCQKLVLQMDGEVPFSC